MFRLIAVHVCARNASYCITTKSAASFQEAIVQSSKRRSEVGFGSMLLKKSFSTADQNFSRPLMRFLG
jgi:hypothetical protein